MAYPVPTAADLKALYPAFAAVADATIDARIAWVNGRDLDESWSEADFPYAIMAAAAHRMALDGVPGITGGATSAYAANGVTSFKSGTFDVSFDADAVSRISGGGWNATTYGRDYLDLLARRGRSAGVTNVGCGCYPYA